jgi:hypothetical protein
MINPEQIRQEVLAIMADTRLWHSQREFKGLTKDQFIDQMKIKYEYLHSNSSTLFERCIAGDINMSQFNYMLSMLEKVKAGKDYEQVSVEVGQKLVDVYVKPMLNEKK